MKKPYPINGIEQDVIYARKILCILKNNTKLVKFIKQKMNKRFRKSWRQELKS
jgi:hypothetical protein